MPETPLSDFLKKEIDSDQLETYKTAIRSFFTRMPDELTPTYSWYLQQLEPVNKLTAICLMENLIYYSSDLLISHLKRLGHDNDLTSVLSRLSSSFEASATEAHIIFAWENTMASLPVTFK